MLTRRYTSMKFGSMGSQKNQQKMGNKNFERRKKYNNDGTDDTINGGYGLNYRGNNPSNRRNKFRRNSFNNRDFNWRQQQQTFGSEKKEKSILDQFCEFLRNNYAPILHAKIKECSQRGIDCSGVKTIMDRTFSTLCGDLEGMNYVASKHYDNQNINFENNYRVNKKIPRSYRSIKEKYYPPNNQNQMID